MKKWIVFSLLFFAGCQTAQKKWWDHPVNYFGKGYAFVGTADDEDEALAKESAKAQAQLGMAALLRTKVKSMATDIEKEIKGKYQSKTKENLLEMVQGFVGGQTTEKWGKDSETGTTYYLLILKDPAVLFRMFKAQVLHKFPKSEKEIEKMIQRQEGEIKKARQEFDKETQK